MSAQAPSSGRGEAREVRLTMMRRAMVRRMDEAAAIPCFYLRLGADVSRLLADRAALRAAIDAGDRPGLVPSVNDVVVRAAALALRAHPAVNASFEDGLVREHARVNVGVAIAVDGGLVVPAVYDADRKTAPEIAADVRALAAAARDRKLSRDVLADATFTISNLGMYGIEAFDPILNPPQAAILGVGAARQAAGATRLDLTLGCDHRVLTGAEAAPFLVAVKERLEAGDAGGG